MNCIILPFGQSGWSARTQVFEQLLSARPAPPPVYNDILILVASMRMKRFYGKLLLDFVGRLGSSSCVQPEMLTLPQFIEKMYARIAGPVLIDENTRLILLEGRVKEHLAKQALFDQRPDLLAPSLSAALARTIEQFAAAGITPDALFNRIRDAEFSDKPQARLLVDMYRQYSAALERRGLSDPSGIRQRILNQFDPAWLKPYKTIIIDGIQDTDRLDTDILRRIVENGCCTYLLNGPSTAMISNAGDLHPLSSTRNFLNAMAITAPTEIASSDGDDLYLAEALFSDRPFADIAGSAPASFYKTVNLLSAVNPREEASLIARRVKRSLLNGTPPDSILIVFPSLDEYGTLIEEILNDYGIPYNRALGRQLSTSPVASAVVALLRACQDDFSGPSLLRIFGAPLLKFGELPALSSALDRLLRKMRITGGKERLLDALQQQRQGADDRDLLSAPLQDLFQALEPFSAADPASLTVWMERLEKLLAWCGINARVDRIRGPLNINLQAYRSMLEVLVSLANAGRLLPEYTYTFNEWLFLLKKTLMHARYQVPPEDEGGVQVLGLEESAGNHWQEIYFGGLVDGKFPQRLPQNIFLPESVLEALGVRSLENSRLRSARHFYRLLLSARSITLSWPENEADRPVVPSPFLHELTSLRMAGLINRGIEQTSGIQFSLNARDCLGVPDLAKTIGLRGLSPAVSGILNAPLEGMSGIRSALLQRQLAPSPLFPPRRRTTYRVTELDQYLACPYDYYVTRILGIKPLEQATEDISPADRGSKVHAILRDFYLTWKQPVMVAHRSETLHLLHILADAAFANNADTVRNRRQKSLFLNVMAERFFDAEVAFWEQGMRPEYLEEQIEAFPLTLSNGDSVSISGTIDRIDLDQNGNFIIVDYKTGIYPQPKRGMIQKIFQLPVYANMALWSLANKVPALKKPIGLAYYDLQGRHGGTARDVVLYNAELGMLHPAIKPQASARSEQEFAAILRQSMDQARLAIEGILAGKFPAHPADDNTCRSCPNAILCGKDNDHEED